MIDERSENEFVALGKISGPVGLKGEFKITPWADSPERFRLLKRVWIGHDPENVREFAVEGIRITGRNTVLKLGGIESRSAAEEIKNQLILIPGSDIVRPPEGSFFIDDVLGMNVVTEEGKRVGIIRDILQLPSNDLWQVESGSRLISIPAVKEFIRRVDLRTKTVVIHEVEGLLDL
jgi:16S rRNA processing protein RimM